MNLLQIENEARIFIRNEIKKCNNELTSVAKKSGCKVPQDYATFYNRGYQGLYGGLTQKQIHERKKLSSGQKILDYMNSSELSMNYLRITQTKEKLSQNNLQEKENAWSTHYEVGKSIRTMIQSLGTTLPENLPTPTESASSLQMIPSKINTDVPTNHEAELLKETAKKNQTRRIKETTSSQHGFFFFFFFDNVA